MSHNNNKYNANVSQNPYRWEQLNCNADEQQRVIFTAKK